MAVSDELEKLNQEIEKLSKKLGKEFIPIDNLTTARELFISLNREASTLSDSFDFIAKSFRDSVNELSKQNTELGRTKGALRSISNVANQILDLNINQLTIEGDTLDKLEEKARLQFRSLQIAIESGTLTKSQRKEAENALSREKEFFTNIKKIRQEQAEINKQGSVQLFSGVESVVDKVLGSNVAGPFKEAAKAARTQAAVNKKALGTSIKQGSVLGAGFKSLGKSLGKALGPLALISLAVEAFKELDAGAGNIARGIGVSYRTSLQLQESFYQTALASDSIFVTTKNIGEAFLAINESLGTNAQLSGELLTFQTELVKQAGFSVETATQLSQLSLATGQSSKDITTEFLGQATLLNAQNDSAISERKLLSDIQNISKGTLATFAGQVGELASASFEARKLGVSLKQLEGIADGLLDIESSLAAEFEAEVMTGKQLNLERARFFALTNDIAALGKELQDQDITREKFANMNRLQQEAIAKSIGMSRDELGASLIEQDALNAMKGIEGASAKERFNNLVKEVGLEEAKRRIGDEQLAQQLASASVQERFNQTVEKLKEVFVGLVTPLMPVLDVFMDIANIVGTIVRLLDPIIKIATMPTTFLGNLFSGQGLGQSLSNTFGGVAESLGFDMGTTEDGIAPSSKGPFTITDSFGATTITARGDGLAVSPNIVREDRNTSGTVVLSDAQIQKIANAVRDGASRATINLDGDKVSSRLQTPTVLNTLPGV